MCVLSLLMRTCTDSHPHRTGSSEHFLPNNLPKPVDDKACNHLWAMDLPSLPLKSTEGTYVDLSKLPGLTVLFCFPRMGKPKEPIPEDWNSIPGARGCTPQACTVSVAAPDLKSVGISNIFSLSTQEPEHQKATRQYLRLRHHLLSDEKFAFCDALRLPVLEWRSTRFIKRVTLLIDRGKIIWVDYPIFPATKSAETIMNFMKTQPINQPGHGRCGNDKASLAPPPSPSFSPAGPTFPQSSNHLSLPSPKDFGAVPDPISESSHDPIPKPGPISSGTSCPLPLLPKGSGDVTGPASESSGSKSHDPVPNSDTTSSNPGRSSPSPPRSSAAIARDPVPKSGTASSDAARASSLPPKRLESKTQDPVPMSSTASSQTGSSSPLPLKNTRTLINPVPSIAGLKFQGPVTIYHPCPDWTAKMAEKAKGKATPKVTGEVTGNSTPNTTGEVTGISVPNVSGEVDGDVNQNQDGSGKEYSFNIGGKCTFN